MTIADLSDLLPFWTLLVVGGSLLACRSWWSRIWFILITPPIYVMLWFTLGAVLILIPGLSGSTHLVMTTFATVTLYVLTCIVLYRDGPRGVALVGGLGSRKRRGADDGTVPPPPITHRRMSLK